MFKRAIYQECEGAEKYWNLIDKRLMMVRKLAGSDAAKVVRCVSLYGSSAQYTYILIFIYM